MRKLKSPSGGRFKMGYAKHMLGPTLNFENKFVNLVERISKLLENEN